MGEKSRRLKSLLAAEPRCIYCCEPAATIEHMPPKLIFFEKRRPNGLEFAACRQCNNGTKAADAVAALFSRLSQLDDGYWPSKEGERLRATVQRDAPAVFQELLLRSRSSRLWTRNRNFTYTEKTFYRVNSPLVKAYLDVFAGKLAMGLYREYVGQALPMDGGIQTIWHLNAGLTEETAKAYLRILPGSGTLRQGEFRVPEQFSYRYNTDGRSIVAALVALNDNLFFFLLATSQPTLFGLPHSELLSLASSNFMKPGSLIEQLRTNEITLRNDASKGQ